MHVDKYCWEVKKRNSTNVKNKDKNSFDEIKILKDPKHYFKAHAIIDSLKLADTRLASF